MYTIIDTNMLTIEQIIVFGVALEFMLLLRFFWQFRNIVFAAVMVLHLLALALIVLRFNEPLYAWAALLIVFRIINSARTLANRKHQHHLRNVTARSITVLGLIQLVLLVPLIMAITPNYTVWLLSITTVQLGVALAFLAWVTNSLHQTRYHGHNEAYSDKELPSVTVAIPARNETADLQTCIDSVIASNYPKLEVLVLDDCSQDKTPDIIKQYAHAGVRFIEGTAPPDNWLAKNHAYNQLAREASGSFILFCGVDVRMSPDFIRNLITHVKRKKKRMISVLPMRLAGDLRSSFIQPMRYWWELALPRKFLDRPAVLSTCWLIDAKVLQNLGSFSAVKRSVLPERFFARECVRHDAYSFIRANEELDLRTTKQPREQIRTAARVRYPQMRNRLENTLFFTLGLHVFLLGPYIVFSYAFLTGSGVLQTLSGLSILLLTSSHVMILVVTHPTSSLAGLVNFPFVVTVDMALSIYSMARYEFGRVIWKGRNVCMPVLSAPDHVRSQAHRRT